MRINTGELLIRDGAQIQASTFGEGQGGNLRVNASKSVELSGTSSGSWPSGLLNEAFGTGSAGDSTISTEQLTVQGNAVVSASTAGAGGSAGNLTIQVKQLTIWDGGQISAGTFGEGQGGRLEVFASDSVELSGTLTLANGRQLASGIYTQTNGAQAAGYLRLQTGQLTVRNGARVFTGTNGIGAAGDLTINTGQLLIQDGAQVSAATYGRGKGGNLTVTANKVQLIGISANDLASSGLIAGTQGTGKAGDLTITTQQLLISDGALITVSSRREGVAGNLGITANSVQLNNGEITAQTRSGNGGNLKLNVANLLLLRHNSQISTTAGTARQGGNGGNITIDVKDGFIVAVPNENSDITANAFSGKGGIVTINATGIFGMVQRSRQDLERFDLDPGNLPTNDVTAISQTNPSLSGSVQINTPDIDPSRGLVNLPAMPIDTNVAQGCTTGAIQNQSRFVVTGRGGLPLNPREAFNSDTVRVGWVTLKQSSDNRDRQTVTTPTISTPAPIIEATGWVSNAKGEIVLTANPSSATPHNSWQTPPTCSVPTSARAPVQ